MTKLRWQILVLFAVLFAVVILFSKYVSSFLSVSDSDKLTVAVRMVAVGAKSVDLYYKKHGQLPLPANNYFSSAIFDSNNMIDYSSVSPIISLKDENILPLDPFNENQHGRYSARILLKDQLLFKTYQGNKLRLYVFSDDVCSATGVVSAVVSNGPDRDIDFTREDMEQIKNTSLIYKKYSYDILRGLHSNGDIIKFVSKNENISPENGNNCEK